MDGFLLTTYNLPSPSTRSHAHTLTPSYSISSPFFNTHLHHPLGHPQPSTPTHSCSHVSPSPPHTPLTHALNTSPSHIFILHSLKRQPHHLLPTLSLSCPTLLYPHTSPLPPLTSPAHTPSFSARTSPYFTPSQPLKHPPPLCLTPSSTRFPTLTPPHITHSNTT